jgi:microcystin-dependent protein
MSEPFIGEVRAFGFNFAPRGWALCQGAVLPLAQNTALFALLGTTYGGDGRSTFALPDLRGRMAMGFGQGPGLSRRELGETPGAPTHTLTTAEVPAHGHSLNAVASATTGTPGPTVALANTANGAPAYRTPGATVALSAASLNAVGGAQPHENRQPYLGLNFCIALQGIFPPRS